MTILRYEAERAEVVDTARRMITGGLTAHTSGNVSRRIRNAVGGKDLFAITPHGMDYFEMNPPDVVVVDAAGELCGDAGGTEGLVASAEKVVHLAVYAARPDVGAVIHSHPLYSTMLAVARRSLPALIDEAMVELGGEVRCADYGISGSEDLAEKVVAAVGDDRACFMANHGLLSAGRDLRHAIKLSELIERLCQVYVGAMSLGGPEPLPAEAISLYEGVYGYMRQQERDATTA
jgi:L-fuculose-phosphate aldolase